MSLGGFSIHSILGSPTPFMVETTHATENAWPHRMAVLLACATFPLLWVGGLVTTTQSGMAVPDWPTTYGYNLFLYPWQTWLFGPWDLFIEHGHRLLGATVGLLAIATLVVLIRYERRRWVQGLGLVVLLAIIAQGTLGGLRVIENARMLAMIHGCFGPAVFSLIVALAVVTSDYWRHAPLAQATSASGRLQRLAMLTTGLAYFQLVLGAQLRHLPAMADPAQFRAALAFHLFFAAVLAFHVGLLLVRVWQHQRTEPLLLRPAALLSGLLVGQLILGGLVWIANYGWPAWAGEHWWTASHLTVAGGWLQTHVTTLHVATGSLILATALTTALRALRLLRAAKQRIGTPSSAVWLLEVAA